MKIICTVGLIDDDGVSSMVVSDGVEMIIPCKCGKALYKRGVSGRGGGNEAV